MAYAHSKEREKEAKSGLRKEKNKKNNTDNDLFTQHRHLMLPEKLTAAIRLSILLFGSCLCVFFLNIFLFIFCSSTLILILWIHSTTFLSGSETDCDGFRCYCYICFNFYLISIFILTWWCYEASLVRSFGRSVGLSVCRYSVATHTHNPMCVHKSDSLLFW